MTITHDPYPFDVNKTIIERLIAAALTIDPNWQIPDPIFEYQAETRDDLFHAYCTYSLPQMRSKVPLLWDSLSAPARTLYLLEAAGDGSGVQAGTGEVPDHGEGQAGAASLAAGGDSDELAKPLELDAVSAEYSPVVFRMLPEGLQIEDRSCCVMVAPGGLLELRIWLSLFRCTRLGKLHSAILDAERAKSESLQQSLIAANIEIEHLQQDKLLAVEAMAMLTEQLNRKPTPVIFDNIHNQKDLDRIKALESRVEYLEALPRRNR